MSHLRRLAFLPYRGVLCSPSENRSGTYHPTQVLQLLNKNLLTRKLILTIIRPPSIRQSLEKYWARNFNSLSKLAGGRNQPCGWLKTFQAVKIINSNNADHAWHEKDIESHITQQNPEHRGRIILRTCLEDFEVTGPAGKYMCLKRFVDRQLPLPIAKAYIYYFLLVGLDYLHSNCQVVHTDLKLGNILMSFENENILTSFIQRKEAMQFKVDAQSGRTIYRCHKDFGALDGREIKHMIPKIADFGLATRLDKPSTQDGMVGEKLGSYPIQPDHYRAPEVIRLWLGYQSRDLELWCTGELLAKLNAISGRNWPQLVTTDTGELCNNAQEFFDGPFFNADIEFRHNEMVPRRDLEDTIPFLEKKEQNAFLSFLRQMPTWLPEKRKTARELMDHPFLTLGDSSPAELLD
ncbi:serine/threonine-protein kinase, putative [Talaromyces marneffei ATCC 18224]|uniref:Serine/threonine-protein kinase, putative n=1 Tax=Talaromyces marneffei (strain ATCC 18224 / CBS 334.59 / QM 7333) TaxID=441960 RepID=B6QDV5_TALMQ|nr:serine/threonine-protein kinase, putative [Talaromyces marneffei ATCC 18224]